MNEQNNQFNAKDDNELLRVQRELTVLYEVSNAMGSTLELNHILYVILTGVTAHTGLGFNRAVLFLVDDASQNLIPKMAIGPESGEEAHKIWEFISDSNQHFDDLVDSIKSPKDNSESKLFESIKDLVIPFSDHSPSPLLTECFQIGTPLHIQGDQLANYKEDELLKRFKTEELVIMPLKAKDKINGLIVADNLFTHKPIQKNDLRIFQMLANLAGLAIENSHLYEVVIEKSHTDSLTDLWNHGYFQRQMNEHFELSKNTSSVFSLMIVDIDNFKKLNDTYGHQYGDVILKEIAIILKSHSRKNDFYCRYGGEEFAMILPQTEKQDALSIAETIRTSVEQYSFPQTTDGNNVTITVSIGIATFPEDAQSKEDLIMQADKAMYKAKFSGKNNSIAA